MEQLKKDKVLELLKRRGQKGYEILSILKSQEGFYDNMVSDVGYELLKEVMAEADILLGKVIDMKASDEEKMEYKVMKKLLLKWNLKIQAYEQNVKNINEGKV